MKKRLTTAHFLRSMMTILCFSLISLGSLAQEQEEADPSDTEQDYSLQGQLAGIEGQLDTVQSLQDRCLLLVEYAHTLRWIDLTDDALAIADSAHRMAERLDYFDGRVAVKEAYAHIYLKLGDYDKSLDYQRDELDMRQGAAEVDSLAVGVLYMSISSALYRNGLYYSALDSMEIALDLVRAHGTPRDISITLHELANIYVKMGKPEEGYKYLVESIELLKDVEPNAGMAISLNNKARWLYKDGKYEEAKQCLREAEEYCLLHGFKEYFGDFRSRSGEIAVAEGDYAAAIPLFHEAVEIFESATDTLWAAENCLNLSEAYLKNGDIDNAYQWAKKLESYLFKIQEENLRAIVFKHLAEVYETKGEVGVALAYIHKHLNAELVADSLAEMRQARDLEARFRNDEQKMSLLEKDRELSVQADEIAKKNNRLKLLGFGAIALALLASLLIINYRQRIKSQAQKSELALNQALIESTEEERERIARELHDGTGSLLTGIKLGLDHIQSDIDDEALRGRMDATIIQVQSVAKEVRRVSHAMAPSAIEHLPFEEVVSDLISTFNQIGSAEIDYASSGDFEQMNKTERLMLYRILQECLNNSFKHADAKEINISLNATADEIEMLYQDDGTGYDPSKIKDGLGLSSIEKRISYLHGKRTLETESGRGMLMIVNFPILRA